MVASSTINTFGQRKRPFHWRMVFRALVRNDPSVTTTAAGNWMDTDGHKMMQLCDGVHIIKAIQQNVSRSQKKPNSRLPVNNSYRVIHKLAVKLPQDCFICPLTFVSLLNFNSRLER